MNLLQISTSQAIDTVATGSSAETISLFDLLTKGGFMMIPLLLLSVMAVAIFIERMYSIKNASKIPSHFTDQIRNFVTTGNIDGAKMLCGQTNSPVARMIEKGISRIGSPLKNIEVSIENVGKIEIYKLEKNLSLLATIAGAAPMIGFLGTVTGMIQAFMAISNEEGSVSPKHLSTGLYEAMVTTATGLAIGIIAYLLYNYLVARVQKVIHKMEYSSIDFIDLLQEPR